MVSAGYPKGTSTAMRLSADHKPKAARQLTGDLLVLLWTVSWVRIGQHLTSLVDRLGGPGRTLATAGTRLEDGLGDVAGGIGRLPVVGGSLEGVFGDADGVGGAGAAMRDAGLQQAEVAHQLAVALGVVVAALAITLVLSRYLPGRLRWIREAGAARSLLVHATDLRLFAFRAVANRPLSELRSVSADPGADLAAGRFDRLAALELAELGLRPASGTGRSGLGASQLGVHVQ